MPDLGAGPNEPSVVNDFGYAQELRRTLRSFSVFSVAFSIMSITTGIFLNFGTSFAELGPAMIWTWPVVAIGQILVTLVMAEMAAHIPLAGASYQWAARLVGPTYGWFVGALGVMFGAVGLPGIVLLAAAPLSEYVLHDTTASPRLTLFIALLLLSVAYLVNVISVQLATRVNNVAVLLEILGAVALAVVLFSLWVGGYRRSDHGIEYLAHHFHPPGQSYWYAIVLASLLGLYTLVGFESAADMSEEALDARRSVPRAMIGSVVVSSVLGMIVLIGFAVAVPSDRALAEGGLPGVFEYWIGPGPSRLFVSIVVCAIFALTVIGAAASARLLYAMARDNMLPGSRLLRSVNPSMRTPIAALGASYLICVAVMIYGYLSIDAFGTLVGATALIPFVVYLLTLVAYGLKRRQLKPLRGAFQLGRFARPVYAAALVWIVAVVLALALPSPFHTAVCDVAGGLVLAALWWLVGLRPRLARHGAGPALGQYRGAINESGPQGQTRGRHPPPGGVNGP